jgi:flagellar protein FlaG
MSSISQSGLTLANQTRLNPVNDLVNPPLKVVNDIDNKIVSKVINDSTIKPSNIVQNSAASQEVIAKAAQQIQSFVQAMGRNLSFSIDESTGYHVVTVVNPETNEVIRQLPSEELLKIAKNMDQLKNALVSQLA